MADFFEVEKVTGQRQGKNGEVILNLIFKLDAKFLRSSIHQIV